MYGQLGAYGTSKFIVVQFAAEFGTSRPTVYRYLDQASHVAADA